MSNSHLHPLFQGIVDGFVPRDPIKQASAQLKHQAHQLANMRRLLDEQRAIIEDLAPSDFRSEEEATYDLPIPQHVVIEAVKELLRVQHVEFASIMETKFKEYIKQENNAAAAIGWEDRQ